MISINSNERWAVIYFFVLMLVFSFGTSITRSLAMTLLVQHMGGEVLPYIFIMIDGIAMFAFFAYANYSKKIAELRLLSILFMVAILYLSSLLICIHVFEFVWLYAAIFVGFFICFIMITTHMGTFFAAYFTTVQLKRVTYVINLGLPIGGMLGGASLVLLLQYISEPESLMALTVLAYIMALFILNLINTRLSSVRTGCNKFILKQGVIKQLSSAFNYIISARLMKYMSLGMVLFVVSSKLMEYQYQVIIYPETFPQPTDRARFFAIYEFWGNFVWIFLQLLMTSKLLSQMSIGARSLIHPVLMMLGSIGLFFRFGFAAGVTSHFINQEMRGAIRSPTNNLLFNAVPPNMWGTSKAFLNGIAFPLATIIASILLLTLSDFLSKDELRFYLPLITLVISVFSILTALPQWTAYNEGVFGLLKHRFFANKKQICREKVLLAMVNKKLESVIVDEIIIALDMIALLKADEFVNSLGELLQSSQHNDDTRVTIHCIKTLAALPQSKDITLYLQNALLNAKHADIIAQLLLVLVEYQQPSQSFIIAVEKLLQHCSPNVFVAASLYLFKQSDYQSKKMLEQAVIARIKQSELPQFELYLQALGELKQSQYRSLLLPFLDDSREKVRLAAFKANIQLLQGDFDSYQPVFIKALESSNKEMKLAALFALKQCSQISDWNSIIKLLDSSDSVMVEQGKEILCLHLNKSKEKMFSHLFSGQVPVKQSFEILSIIYPHLKQKQKTCLSEQADHFLEQFVYLQILLVVFQKHEPESTTKLLIEKIIRERAAYFLHHVLIVITYHCNQQVEFFNRVCFGLQSKCKSDQGNALEVLSHGTEKYISGRVLYYFQHQETDLENQLKSYQILFKQELLLSSENYPKALLSIQHNLLQACLLIDKNQLVDNKEGYQNSQIQLLLHTQ